MEVTEISGDSVIRALRAQPEPLTTIYIAEHELCATTHFTE